jgi:drug/metabolite transporter (DMT)-like permease
MLKSVKKNKYGILLMCISSICVCIGQLFWKISSINNIPFLILGFVLYGVGAIVMLVAYRFGSLSVLQPVLSLNYVFSIILAKCFLGEPIRIMKVIGVIIIISGVILIAGGDD